MPEATTRTLPGGLTVTVVAGGQVAVACEGALRALDEGRLPEGAVCVKRNNVREVFRATISGTSEIYLKRERPKGFADALRYFIRTPRGVQEGQNLERLRLLNLPCPEPLFYGVRRRRGVVQETVLAMRSLGEVGPVGEALQPGASDSVTRERYVERLIELAVHVRTFHDEGLYHRDLHLHNVVLRRSGGELGPAFLVDVQKMVRLPWAVPRRLRGKDLGRMTEILQPAEQARVFERYANCRRPHLPERGLQLAAERASRAYYRRHMRSRDKRCLVHSSQFRAESAMGGRLFRRVEILADAVNDAIGIHQAAVGEPRGCEGQAAVVKQGSASAVTRQTMPVNASEGADSSPQLREVAVKSYRRLSVLSRLLRGRSRARRAWCAAQALTVRGIGTPRALALSEQAVDSYLIAEWPENVTDLPTLVRQRFAQVAPHFERRVPVTDQPCFAPREEGLLAFALGEFVGKLHREGLYHGDLKPPNLLVQEVPGAPPRLLLIDLEALAGRLTSRRRAKNLAQLEDFVHTFLPGVRRTHRARFLRAYFGAVGDMSRVARRSLIAQVRAEVEARSARRLETRPELGAPGSPNQLE
jgi:tRNA A-37 threonylcarbamoyl transferase component Bud32